MLDNITVNFQKGKIYGLVGRNGSGKTVLLKCICGFIKPSQGQIIINENKKYSDFGIMFEHAGFLPNYSGYNNLKMLAMIQNKISKDDIIKVMNLVGLDPKSSKKVVKYSLGMKQRLGIAQSIMENQDIIILDEPTNGLDNESVIQIRKIIMELKEKDKLVIISSHFKEDIDLLCDEVMELDKGKMIKYIKKSE